jgi:hypothetical protein
MDDSPEETEPSTVLTPDSENATHFNPDEVEETTSYGTSVNYQRLKLLNRGTWKSRYEENKEVTHRQDNLAIFDSISSQVELTDFQKKKARRTFDNFDLQDFGKPVKLVAFGVCAVVANDDVPNGSRYHPQMKKPDELFSDLAGELGFTESQLHSIIGVVNNRRGQ